MADESDLPALPASWGPVLEISATGVNELLLTDCRFERVAGRLFLTGLNCDCESAGGSPRQAVAWDAVIEVVSFRSVGEYRNWLRARQASYEAHARANETPF
jgi:hypothetical protein